MADFRASRKKTRRKPCGPGRHWVEGHYAKNWLGSGVHWVKGHCADDGEAPGMKVVGQTTETGVGFPPTVNRVIKIEEKPMDEQTEEEGNRT